MKITKLWIGGENEVGGWYCVDKISAEKLVSFMSEQIVTGAQAFWISLSLDSDYVLDIIKKDGIYEVMPVMFHIHGAPTDERFDVVKEKIKEMDGVLYAKLMVL